METIDIFILFIAKFVVSKALSEVAKNNNPFFLYTVVNRSKKRGKKAFMTSATNNESGNESSDGDIPCKF